MKEAELNEVYHNVEEVSTQTQSQTGYGSLIMMIRTIGVGYCDSEVGTRYYDSRLVHRSLYIDASSSNSYMHGHECAYGEHNEYLYYEEHL